MRVVYSLLLAMLAMLEPSGAAQEALRVGAVTAAAGETVSGFIEVPPGVDEGTRIPVTVIRGVRPGPALALFAGNHGYEYSPILALQRLRSRIDARQLAGTVILVHVANMPSFLKRTIYYSPVDGKNLNRVYPGKADGTISERIAYALTREVIDRADYMLDLHCGDGNEWLRPYAYWIDSGQPKVDATAREMALAFGFDHIVIDRDRPRDPAASQYASNTAILRGKPALTVESGGLGAVPGGYLGTDEAIDRLERGVRNVLAWLKMTAEPYQPVEHALWIDRNEVLRSQHAGIWYPVAERGQSVAGGTLLGVVTDFFGKRLAEVRAPFAGEVLYIVHTPPISAGEPLAMIGRIQGQ